MLIIAIPKSASTSLMKTLGDLHPEIEVCQDFSFRENNIPKNSRRIHLVHSDIREIGAEEVKKFQNPRALYKQHIFPSENNLQALKETPKVVLLRNPTDIIEAYQRGAKKNHNSLPPGYTPGMKKQELSKKASEDGFFNDVDFFYHTWKNQENKANTLLIYYSDYIKDPKETINKIESFLDLPLTDTNVKPVKARFSRNDMKDHLHSFKKKFRYITTSILSFVGLKKPLKKIFGHFSRNSQKN